MTHIPRICVVGSSNIDLVCRVERLPKPGETLVGHSFQVGCGGKGANQAVMAAKLGAHVTMVTKLGRDAFGGRIAKNYREQGIDTDHVMFDDRCSSGVAVIFVDDHAQNYIVIVPGANFRIRPSDVQAVRREILAAGLIVCQLEIPIEATMEAFRIARSGNTRTILNPAPAASLPDEILQLTDICAPNENEIEILTRRSVRTLAEAKRAARALLGRGPKTVVVTLGERGALLVDKDSAEHIPAVKVAAVDTTGAGDAFIGSLAVFLGEGFSLRDAILYANAVAALSVTKSGTQVAFPNRAEVDAFLRQHELK